MQKPSYSVVTGVVATLAIFGFVAKACSRLVPLPESNRMEGQRSDFLRQAMRHAIDWRALGDEALDLAKASGKPILLVLGTSWSRQARRVDAEVFTDMEVQALLNQRFVCVRADLTERPDLTAAYLPLSRAGQDPSTGTQNDFDAAFQVWILDSGGQLFSYITAGIQSAPDSAAFLSTLVEQLGALEIGGGGANQLPPPGTLQRGEIEKLNTVVVDSPPDGSRLIAAVASSIHPTYGGFPVGAGTQILRPQAHLLFAEVGREDLFRRATDPLLRSYAVDWLDGGFFRKSTNPSFAGVEFDKQAVSNAEMAVALARGSVAFREPIYKRVAEMTFDSLLDGFVQNGVPAAGRVGDELPQGRSKRSSFSAAVVRRFLGESLLTSEEAAFARESMDLDPLRSRKMTVRLDNPAVSLEPKFEAVRLKLRASKAQVVPAYSTRSNAEVAGLVVARLIETATALQDSARLKKAVALLPRLDGFFEGDRLKIRLGEPAYVGSYLAVCDALLQAAFATRDRAYAQKGVAKLLAARRLFGQSGSPLWRASIDAELPDTSTPELVDNLAESCVARQIRMLSFYGLLLDRRDLVSEASAAAAQASRWGLLLGPEAAGCIRATYLLEAATSNAP